MSNQEEVHRQRRVDNWLLIFALLFAVFVSVTYFKGSLEPSESSFYADWHGTDRDLVKKIADGSKAFLSPVGEDGAARREREEKALERLVDQRSQAYQESLSLLSWNMYTHGVVVLLCLFVLFGRPKVFERI